eukprot:1835307-Ditylum_brightwellii.AAC.1
MMIKQRYTAYFVSSRATLIALSLVYSTLAIAAAFTSVSSSSSSRSSVTRLSSTLTSSDTSSQTIEMEEF